MNNYHIDTAVAIVVFNRLDCVKELIDSISYAAPPRLYIISDGPRENVPGEIEKVSAVRKWIENNVKWKCELTTLYSDYNMGCDQRSISGYNFVFQHEERAILIEDDAIPTKEFYSYCEKMLIKYEKNQQIMMVTGRNNTPEYREESSYWFSMVPPKRAWGTWRRAWVLFDGTMSKFKLNKLFAACRKMPFEASVYYLGAILGCVNGGTAWDCKWDYCIMAEKGLGIVPCDNMIKEIGYNREDATHTKGDSKNAHVPVAEEKFSIVFREKICQDYLYDDYYLSKCFKGSKAFCLREFILYFCRKIAPNSFVVHYLDNKNR